MRLLVLVFLSFLALPGFGQEDDEKFYEKLEKDRNKKATLAVEFDQKRIEVEERTQNLARDLQKLGHESLDTAALLDDRVLKILQKAFKESKLKNESRDSVRLMVLEKIKGSPLEFLVQKFPVLLEIFIDVMKDSDALPGFIQILSRKEALKNYAAFCLLLFVLSIFIRRRIIIRDHVFLRRVVTRLALSLSFSVISLGVFYTIFRVELAPFLKIIKNYL